jgi:hypothetical protein
VNLTRKAGPLPVWAWAVLGVVVLYFAYKRFGGGGGGGGSPSITGSTADSAGGSTPDTSGTPLDSAQPPTVPGQAATPEPDTGNASGGGDASGSGGAIMGLPPISITLVSPKTKRHTAASAHASHHVARHHHAHPAHPKKKKKVKR